MAIQMEKEDIRGCVGNYWNLASVQIHTQDKVVGVWELYLSQEKFQAGKKPLETQMVVLSQGLFDMTSVNSFDELKLAFQAKTLESYLPFQSGIAV